MSIHLLGIGPTDVKFETLERLAAEHLLAMVPKAKLLVNGPQLWSPSRAVQTEEPAPPRTRKPDCMTEKQVGKPLTLPRWNDRELVQIDGGPVRDLGPEVWIFGLKSKHADWLRAEKPEVIEPLAHVPRNCELTHFGRRPQLYSRLPQLRSGRG